MAKDKTPQVIVIPELQAELDADPDMAKAIEEFKKVAIEAMQGVKDGKYPDMDTAMEFLTGHRPRIVSGNIQEFALSRDDDEDPKAN